MARDTGALKTMRKKLERMLAQWVMEKCQQEADYEKKLEQKFMLHLYCNHEMAPQMNYLSIGLLSRSSIIICSTLPLNYAAEIRFLCFAA